MYNLGDTVKINNTNLIGKVNRIKKNKNNLLYTVSINSNSSKITVSEENLSLENSKIKNNTKPKVNISYSFDNSNFTNEIMLRHQTVEVAIENLERFISQAICNKEKRVRIIHGRHGGILREAVHKYLDTCPYVESYKLAEYYEGSYGVTIAYLK